MTHVRSTTTSDLSNKGIFVQKDRASKGKQSKGQRERMQARVDGPLMDVAQTAAYLGLSPNTIYAEVQAGRLPVVRIRKRIFIVRKLLDEMLIAQARRDWKTEAGS